MLKRNDNMAALLRAYLQRQANPDRVGCPAVQTLEAFPRGQLQRDVVEWLYDHLPHCRECLLELKVLHETMRPGTAAVGR